MNQNELIRGVNGLSERLNVSRATIFRWKHEGLPCIQRQRTIFFNIDEVMQWMKSVSTSTVEDICKVNRQMSIIDYMPKNIYYGVNVSDTARAQLIANMILICAKENGINVLNTPDRETIKQDIWRCGVRLGFTEPETRYFAVINKAYKQIIKSIPNE